MITREVPACSPDLSTNWIASPSGRDGPLGAADGIEDGNELGGKERLSGKVDPVTGNPLPLTVFVVVVVAVDVDVYVITVGARVTLIVILFSI